jgi:hypothetical protein
VRGRSTLASLIAALLALALAPSAAGARGIELGFADDRLADNLLFNSDPAVGDLWAGRMGKVGADLVRLNAYWRTIAAGSEPADATDPNDPAYDWSGLDRAVRAAAGAGVEPVLTVLSAPDFAEGSGRPDDVRPGTWKPRPAKFEDFAVALARRYSGDFPDPESAGNLPRVHYYEGWNEPNLHLYITPQRSGSDKNKSPAIYRDLLNRFYAGIKAVDSSAQVLAAGTSPFGDPSGDRRIPPVEFWRDVLCLKNRKKLKFDKGNCPSAADRAHFDVFTHNSINSPGDGPAVPAELADNATAADMYKLVDVIRAAEKHGSVQPQGEKRDVWSTELWFESSPPERKQKAVPLGKQARHVAQALYVLWEQKISAGIFLQIRDSPFVPGGPAVVGLQSGIYFEDGSKKPSYDAARFPFVAERRSKKKITVWGKPTDSGKLRVQVKKGGWKTVDSFGVKASKVFAERVKLKGKAKVRGRLGKQKTITWPVKKR